MASPVNRLESGLLRVYADAYLTRRHVQVVDCSALATDGWESDLYTCDIEYEEYGERRREPAILKLYHGDNAGAKAEREFAGLRHLTQAGYPVPRPFIYDAADATLGRPFVLMERVAGRELRDVVAEADPGEQQQLLTLFCRLFVDLHALDWRAFVPNSAAYHPQSHIRGWLDLAERYVADLPVPTDTFAPVFAWLRARVAEVECERLSVVHRDFHGGIVLLRQDGSPIVIDWTAIEVSDYRFDLAWTLLLSSTYGQPEVRELILAEYERLAGRPVEQLAFFDVTACARRLVDIATTLGAGAQMSGMRPEAEAAIRRQAEHVRRVYALLRGRIGQPLLALERILATL
jgi:aminoglycoside phosphotransferase (APT) family kinase protein